MTPIRPVHQLVFLPHHQGELDWETIHRLIYRADLDAIEEHSTISHPEELNRRPGQLAAVGRFRSVLWRLQDYVESAVVLSAAMTVSAASVAANVRKAAYDHLRTYRATASANGRPDLEEMAPRPSRCISPWLASRPWLGTLESIRRPFARS